MKYFRLAGMSGLLFLAVVFLLSVKKEADAFGYINHTPEGEPIGILNSPNYPYWFYLGIGGSIGAIIAFGRFVFIHFIKTPPLK